MAERHRQYQAAAGNAMHTAEALALATLHDLFYSQLEILPSECAHRRRDRCAHFRNPPRLIASGQPLERRERYQAEMGHGSAYG
jgi:hypothetical protein